MSEQTRGPSRTKDNPIVLDIRGMRVAVRTDAGDGPVLVDDVSLELRRGEVAFLARWSFEPEQEQAPRCAAWDYSVGRRRSMSWTSTPLARVEKHPQ